MYGCESWTIKKIEGQRIDAFELWCWRRLLRALDCKEIQPVHPKGNQSGIFIGRTRAEAETPIVWLPDANNWLIWKDPDAEKDWKQEEKGTTEDEMVGSITDSMDMSLRELQELVIDREARHVAIHWVAKRRKQLSNWNEPNWNAGESVEKREPSYTVGGNENWYSYCGEQHGGSLKNAKWSHHMILPSHSWPYIWRKL